ncbi:VOC family protein [Pedomonas sp. V897]|uniref:VOC family protein n=1 Tax=Pedomonas sp. V897 TaxID=3446482 RepID=UPI003EE41F20
MQRMIFVNLPVRDLARSTAFYEALGFAKNPQFSNDDASCMMWSEVIVVMLHTHEHFLRFSPRPVSDATKACEVLLCLSAETREAVDALVQKAGTAGGGVDPCPVQDHGFMYGRSYEDPDGHIWEVVWMDPAAVAESNAGNTDAQSRTVTA